MDYHIICYKKTLSENNLHCQRVNTVRKSMNSIKKQHCPCPQTRTTLPLANQPALARPWPPTLPLATHLTLDAE